jgi:hypothetical protein
VDFCADTCHLLAAGYDLVGDFEGVWRSFDRALGLDRLAVLHLNDSKGALASRLDRHALIGDGELGRTPFRNIMVDPRFRGAIKVIETPKVSAVAKDGIQLVALAKVTVRANIERLVGGAGEETILARVGEGIVSTIGSSATHKDVLANPDLISKTVLQKGLDSGTAFEILSIDIADVDVGRNIGAMLQTDQAEADKRIAQARAEEREALEDMVRQFGHWSTKVGGYSTGGLSTLENAFKILGWSDPHPMPGDRCQETGCLDQATCGIPTPQGYARLCGDHFIRRHKEVNHA